jgi:hypothetical protein
VRFCGNSILVILLILCSNSLAADAPVAHVPGSIVMKGSRAQCWDQGTSSVVELNGPIHIELDNAKMSADNAVVWINPNPQGPPDSHQLQIALVGNGQLQQDGVLRLDRRLLVNAVVTGNIQLVANRVMGPDESSALYLDAVDLRAGKPSTTSPATAPAVATTTTTATEPAPAAPGEIAPIAPLTGNTPARTKAGAATARAATSPAPSPWLKMGSGPTTSTTSPSKLVVPPPPPKVIQFDGDYQRAVASDGTLAAVVTNGVSLSYRDASQNLYEFVARDMVLFTNLKAVKGAGEGERGREFIADHIISAYFEGDVRVYVTPSDYRSSEMRMRAEHVYYEFATDRAIMTDVVFHTMDLTRNIPIFVRASKLRQLSLDEFNFENVEMTDSAFAAPTFSIRAAHAYVRAEDTGDVVTGERVTFTADNATMNALTVPFFYFPLAAGEMDSKGFPLRTIGFNNDSIYGTGVRTRWGLFETISLFAPMVTPKDWDVSYTLDYLSRRGPAGGADATYAGGIVDDTTHQPVGLDLDLHSYFVEDHGTDTLGAARNDEKPTDDFRGRLIFQNQWFFPENWQLQLRLGYVSDSNFMAQWFNDEYLNNLTIDDSVYLKHAHDSESYSFFAETQPNRAISTADEEQENREISRLPELTYDRVGDSVADDHLTFFSEDTTSALKFVRNTESLTQQGFYPGVEPGLPSYAYTGDPGSTTYRGDFRQELDFPIHAGVVNVVPYAFVRYTPYSQGVVPPKVEPQFKTLPAYVETSGPVNRVIGGGGLRLTTSFFKVDNTIESDLFDLHRLRHIVEPEINIFGSQSNVDQDHVFIYDPEVDGINDVLAVQLALRQRWQTKRGGPGRWRSVDVFALNMYVNYFGNTPPNRFRDPIDFRGLYFYSNPEASVPRNSANADATWRVSDSTAVLMDVEQNLDKVRLATASIGVAIQRDVRLSYFIGTRYIADLNSNIITLDANYKLDNKYSLSASQSFDLAQNKDVAYSFSLVRSFDTLSMSVTFSYDQATSDKSFSFNINPFGVNRSVGANNATGVSP